MRWEGDEDLEQQIIKRGMLELLESFTPSLPLFVDCEDLLKRLRGPAGNHLPGKAIVECSHLGTKCRI